MSSPPPSPNNVKVPTKQVSPTPEAAVDPRSVQASPAQAAQVAQAALAARSPPPQNGVATNLGSRFAEAAGLTGTGSNPGNKRKQGGGSRKMRKSKSKKSKKSKKAKSKKNVRRN